MHSIRLIWSLIVLLLVSTLLLIFGAGCSGPYNGPTIGSVALTGSYGDKEGDTYGGGVDVGLNYPTPAPTPKPVDHSK